MRPRRRRQSALLGGSCESTGFLSGPITWSGIESSLAERMLNAFDMMSVGGRPNLDGRNLRFSQAGGDGEPTSLPTLSEDVSILM